MATETPIVRAETWLKQHERIIIVALILAVGAFGLNKYFDVASIRADARAVAAEQVATAAKANSSALALQASQTQAQYTALVQTLAAQNASLASSIAQRTASSAAQKTKDATLPVTGVADRWNTVAGTLVTPSGDTIVVSSTDAHKTLDMIEQVPVLTQNLTDETKIAGNYLQELVKSDALSTELNAQITGLNIQIVDQTKACTAQVAAIKADARKGKVIWFKRGFIVGFISGIFAGHAAGL
jgi:hypothetical protein